MCSPGITAPGGSYLKSPDARHGAEGIVQVEPLQAARAVAPHRAEVEPLHEGRIEHDAGDDGDDEEQAHDAEEQLAGQSPSHLEVPRQHQVEEATNTTQGQAYSRESDGRSS